MVRGVLFSILLFIAAVAPAVAEIVEPPLIGQMRALRAAILAGSFDRAERIVADHPLILDVYYDSTADLADPYDRWIAERPFLAVAYFLRGRFWENYGWQRRGGEVAAATPRENLRARGAAFARAELDYRKAISLDPDLAPAHEQLINVLGTTSRLGEAMAHYAGAVERGVDTNGMALRVMGSATPWWSDLDTEESVAFAEKVAEGAARRGNRGTDPVRLAAYAPSIRAQVLRRSGQKRAALAAYETIVAAPGGAYHLDAYGRLLEEFGREDEALEARLEFARVKPYSDHNWGEIADLLRDEGRFAEAGQALAIAEAINPSARGRKADRAMLSDFEEWQRRFGNWQMFLLLGVPPMLLSVVIASFGTRGQSVGVRIFAQVVCAGVGLFVGLFLVPLGLMALVAW